MGNPGDRINAIRRAKLKGLEKVIADAAAKIDGRNWRTMSKDDPERFTVQVWERQLMKSQKLYADQSKLLP